MEKMADARRGSAAEGRLRLKFPGLSGLEREFIEQAKIFAEPASQKLAMAEPMLKRSIPVLIIAFLLIVAISRMSGMMDEHARMEASSRRTVSLTAAAAAGALQPDGPEIFTDVRRWEIEQRLTEFLPADMLDAGIILLTVRRDGRVFASTQDGAHLVGRTLSAVAPEVATLQYYGEGAGIVRASVDGVDHFIALRQLPHSGGAVLAATSIASFEAAWRDEISLNVTLFAGVSAILMVVLYAYYIQAKRARDADAIFAESNLRVETALSRGRCGLWDFDLDNRDRKSVV